MSDDIVLAWMKKEGVPLTRQNYLDIAYMGSPPEEIGGGNRGEHTVGN